MSLSDIAIRRPVFTAMMSLAIIVFGLLSLGRLPTDLYPPVDFPIILVQTVYPGAPPEDIERDVTRKLEDAVSGISGIEKLQSFTRDSVSIMVMQFEIGSDLDSVTNSVRDRIGVVEKELPKDAEKPSIRQIDIGALPVVSLVVSSNGDTNFTRQLADERLRPLLEQVEGVGTVNVIGGQDREVHIDLDLDHMASLGVPVSQVAERIGYENISAPVGKVEAQGFDIGVRADAQFRSVEDIGNAVVHVTRDGRQVRLGEIARISDAFEDPTRYVRNNGQDAVALEVIKKSGSNSVAVAHGIREKLAEVVPTLGSGAAYDVIFDQSLDIEANAHEVWIAIYFGGAMAILVILFFLLDLRGTLISALALPTSIIGTFAAMYALDFSLNMMTLMGMSLAIGLLIDDAVVVRESITRRLEAGDDPETAASKGTSEIALAVLATTLSLVAVFVPVAFMSGMVGQFFKQFGLTIAVAVLLSLFVAFTLDPMLSARFSKARGHHERRGLARWIERLLDANDAGYRRILDVVLRRRWMMVLATVALLVFTGVVATLLPGEFMPKQDRGEVLANMRLPIATTLEETNAASLAPEKAILALPGVERVYTIIGNEDQSHWARFRVRLADKATRPHEMSWYEKEIRGILETVPSTEVTLVDPQVIEGLGDFPPLMVIVQGADLATLEVEAERVKGLLASIPGAVDARTNMNPGRPELKVEVDRMVASDRGIPAGLVAVTARMLVEGSVVGTLRDGGPEANLRLRADPAYARDPESIRRLPLFGGRGMVTLGEVAKVTMGSGASEINRNNRIRAITVSAQVGDGAALGTIVQEFEARLKKEPLKEGYFYLIDGQAKDMVETAAAMGLALGTAFIFIFMVLASQYESLLHPFTLMVSVPLAMVGAVLGLAVTGNSISMGSQIGIILLMGLVTKNAILLVDGALVEMRAGASPIEAMKVAGPRRLRPILMTSAAMVLGMLPTALSTGLGSEFRAPMGIAVIGGVISSTVLTLLVVPVIFLWMESLRGFLAGLWERLNGASDRHSRPVALPGGGAESDAAK